MLSGSLVALLLGPLLLPLLESRRHWYRLLDGFIVVVILGIVIVDVMPEVLAHHAVLGLVLLGLGLLGPTILERVFHRAAGQVHRTAVMIGVLGLILHAFVDGIVLSEISDSGAYADRLLGFGVILHRLPVGLTVWWLLRPRYGIAVATAALVIMGAGTLGGYTVGLEMGYLTSGSMAILFQAFAAGTILHVVIHRPHESKPEGAADRFAGWGRRAEGIGNLAGLVVVAGIVGLHAGHEGDHAHVAYIFQETGRLFWGMALESAPALLLAYFAGGMLGAFMPASSIGWMQRGSAPTRSIKGVAVGLPLPICTCGVLPLYQSLIKRGAPPTAAMAFLIATPELGIDAILISIPLLGEDMTIVRLVAAGSIALLVGWGVGRWVERYSDSVDIVSDEEITTSRSFSERFAGGLRDGFGGLVDDTAPWILLGLVIAALAHPVLGQGWLQNLPPFVEVLLLAGLGLPIYVCASGATPIVAIMLINGISPGAALAFLLTGPATNVSTYGILSRLHGQKTALLFGAATASIAVTLGLAVNLMIGKLTLLSAADLDLEQVGMFSRICLFVLSIVFLSSFVRRGARAFAGEVISGIWPARSHNHTSETESTCTTDHCHC